MNVAGCVMEMRSLPPSTHPVCDRSRSTQASSRRRAEMRARVPTSNFFQQQGYERNPVARRTAVVANLVADIEGKMQRGAQAQGARDLANAF